MPALRVFDLLAMFRLSPEKLVVTIQADVEKRPFSPLSEPPEEEYRKQPGIYHLCYDGVFVGPNGEEPYAEISGTDTPIYIGKTEDLYNRLRDHKRSIGEAMNLRLEDFRYRLLPMVDNHIILLVEKLSIETHLPIWNKYIKGFGTSAPKEIHAKAGGRGMEWDRAHPGRRQAKNLARTSEEEAEAQRLYQEEWRKYGRTNDGKAIQEAFDDFLDSCSQS